MKNIAISILILGCLFSFSFAEDTNKTKGSSYFGNDSSYFGNDINDSWNTNQLIISSTQAPVPFERTKIQYENFYGTPTPTDTRAKAMQAYGRMPLSFTENQGQTDSTVRFYVQGPTGTMYFTNTEIVMEFIKRNQPMEKPGRSPMQPGMDRSTTPVMEERLVLRRQFLNTAHTSQLFGSQALPGKVNIFRGNDPSKWKQNITTYSEIEYQYLYPGIDVYYSGTNSQLESSIHLAPHANIKPLEFTVQGADKITLAKNGDLQIATKMGTFSEQKPNAYQEIKGQKILIPCKFVLRKKNIIGYELGKYDPAFPLVID